MADAVTVRLTVNGVEREGRCEPRKLLADFLREDLGLTGTHVGCEHGICGACTILIDGEVARSCIMLAVQADGAELLTIEGLMRDGKLHPLQEAFREHHGLQCGFCTPGMLMTALDLLRTNPSPTQAEIREGIAAVPSRSPGCCTSHSSGARTPTPASSRSTRTPHASCPASSRASRATRSRRRPARCVPSRGWRAITRPSVRRWRGARSASPARRWPPSWPRD